jgi:N-acetylmuramate 1-kinase
VLKQTGRQVKRLRNVAQAIFAFGKRLSGKKFSLFSRMFRMPKPETFMSSRSLEIAAFLYQQRWDCAQMQALTGDFSTRRYARLTKDSGETAFLMDADVDQKTPQFLAVAEILRRMGVNAPEIYAADGGRGLVLMEDFGVRNVGALLDAGEPSLPFFLHAAKVLALVHRGFDRTEAVGLSFFDTALFTTQAELFLDAYFPVALGRETSDEEREDFRAAWQAVLRPLETIPKSLLLRDFMPDNLMDLPGEELGILDFQDAGIGPIAYDLASLCEEVRRDGGFALLPDVVAHYREAAQSPLSQSDLLRACTILSAQRHTRILGIIVRLSHKTGQCDKFAFLPRIRHHLETILKEPYLLPFREWVENFDGLLQ